MICVDASLAVKWILEEADSDKAGALLAASVAAGERVVAPPLLPIEVTNILRQRTRGRQPDLSLERATELLRRFLALSVELVVPDELHESALTLAHEHGLSAAYDAHYVALAQLLTCDLWTADDRLANSLKARLPFVRSLRDYPRAGGAMP